MSRTALIIVSIVFIILALSAWWYFSKQSTYQIPINQKDAPTQKEETPPTQIDSSLAIQAAKARLAGMLDTPQNAILLVGAEEHAWPDSCLGLAKSGEVCTQVMTPGFEIILLVNGKEYRYRTNNDGTVIRFDAPPNYK